MIAEFTPQLGRLDRHVRRSHLRMSTGVSQHRVAYSLEEALRLASLPGEEAGRIYCFRRLSITGIPAEAIRSVWMERVQQSLIALSRRSVHGAGPGVALSDAVYFNSLEEALETLLRKALRPGAGESASPQWFATSLLGVAPQTSHTGLIPVILERLRSSLTPGAAAAILFTALGDRDPATLLSSIPEDTIRTWLRAFDEPDAAAEITLAQLPAATANVLERAASQFGWRSPALLWFTTQAVLCASPGAWMQGLAVKKARATLRLLESANRNDPLDGKRLPMRNTSARIRGFDHEETRTAARSPVPKSANPLRDAEDSHPLPPPHAASLVASENASFQQQQRPELAAGQSANAAPATSAPPGESTQAAGLFFLLNALRHAGISAALQAHPVLAEAALPAHVIGRLAADAGVTQDDPVLACLSGTDEPFTLPPESSVETLSLATAWPVGFEPSPHTTRTSRHFLRAWALAVRRWCWRQARLTVGEIVQRRGRVSKTRTDVDVILPLAQADVRIRRVGLDIDPGWLPWFGSYGRVVRFHYRDREPENTAC